MTYKVFMKIFFEKPKYFIIYALLMTTFWYVLFIGVADAVFADYYERSIPDIEIRGSREYSQRLLRQLKTDEMEEYDLSVKNIKLASVNENKGVYQVYAAENTFFEKFEGYLKKGKLPQKGKKQGVIGRQLAKDLKADVGSILQIPLELPGEKSVAYTVSGILETDLAFYSGGFFIPNDIKLWDSHAVYLYAKNQNAYETAKQQLHQPGTDNVILHKEKKVSLYDTVTTSLLKIIPFSAIFLTALFVSFMKHAGRKISLLKAIGLTDKNLMGILAKGFGLFNLCGILNSFLSMGCIMLVSQIPMTAAAVLFTICSYGIILIVTLILLFVLCRVISPEKFLCQTGGMEDAV